MKSPAAVTSASDSATCPITSALRMRSRPPEPSLACSFRSGSTSGRVTLQAGPSPASTVLATLKMSVAASTRRSGVPSNVKTIGRTDTSVPVSRRVPQNASRRPALPPMMAMRSDSVSS